jgi:alkylation response protein AidB-like acyl-CoA dehydrogenase
MNFDFSDDQRSLQQDLRGFLSNPQRPARSRKALEERAGIDRALWSEMGELGWLGIRIPEQFGGSGLGILELALASEEVGRVLAPIPFGPSLCGAAEAILRFGTPDQQARYLPQLANGKEIGALALAETAGPFVPAALGAQLRNGRLFGTKIAVADGAAATLAIVACQLDGTIRLAVVPLDQPAVRRNESPSIDPSRSVATLDFEGAEAELLGGASALDDMLICAAVLQAFEQIGGSDTIFAITREYMAFRHAFGRPIASYQALKHRMADLYTAIELARSNAYYAAWALSVSSPELAEAACCARIAASQAYQLATVEAIQFHGGIGFTWESDCHLFYRRAKWLAASLGSVDEWRERLALELDALVA